MPTTCNCCARAQFEPSITVAWLPPFAVIRIMPASAFPHREKRGTFVALLKRMDDELAAAASPIRDGFLADHRRLESLLQRLVAAFASNDRQEIASRWAELDAGLLSNMEAEEKHLIPALLRAGASEARILVQEHRHIRARLTELGSAFDLHLARLDSVRDFIDELRAHAQSEDRILYRWADVHLDEPGRASIIDALSKKTAP
jgi:hypothetical protein